MTSRRFRSAILLSAVALVVVACGTTTSSSDSAPIASPAVATAAAGAPEPTPASTSVVVSTEAPEDGQTDTDWGRIWDRVPSTFPEYPGSTPSEEASTGPVSAIYAISQGDAGEIASWFQDAAETAGYSTESLSGPMEDGGYILESTGEDPGCRTEVTVAPLGGTISVTIRYGAACPLA